MPRSSCAAPACSQAQRRVPALAPPRSIVAAACLGESECLVRASTDVFTDACPGAAANSRILQFGIV